MLAISVILINLALIAYTVPIFSEIRRKTLFPWHSVMFFIGLICDIVGTFMMYKIGGSKLGVGIHDIFGYMALILMLLNAIGSVLTLKKYKSLINHFYKFSLVAWIIWVGSYTLGIFQHI